MHPHGRRHPHAAQVGPGVRIGALLGPILDPEQGNALAEQARTLAGEGFSSLWSVQAVGRGFMLTDPLIALAVAASVTEDVEVGTAVLQIPLYEPMDLAHRIFSLQQVAGGRFILGVGAGSTPADFAAFGRVFDGRFSDFESSLAALREIFADGSRDGVNLSPWPAVAGGPPIFLGTWGKGVARAATEFDGWIASGMHRTPAQVADAASGYHAAGGGRSIVSTIQVDGSTDLGELKETLAVYREAGFDDAVVMLMPGAPGPAEVRRLVD